VPTSTHRPDVSYTLPLGDGAVTFATFCEFISWIALTDPLKLCEVFLRSGVFAVSDDIIVNRPSVTTTGASNTTHIRGVVSAFDSTKESWTENVPCVVVLRKRGIASSSRNINNNNDNNGDVKKIKKRMDKYETSDEGEEEDEDASNSSLDDDDYESDGYASMSTFDVSLHDGFSDGKAKEDEEDHDNHDDNDGEDLLDVALSSAESGESNDDDNGEERIKSSKKLINAQASSASSSSLLPNRPLLRNLHSDQASSSTRYNIIDSPSETETAHFSHPSR
jgi:hypothetical protein